MGKHGAAIPLLPFFLPRCKNLLPTMDVIFTARKIPRPIYTSVIFYTGDTGDLFTHHMKPPRIEASTATNKPNEYFLGFSSGGLSGSLSTFSLSLSIFCNNFSSAS